MSEATALGRGLEQRVAAFFGDHGYQVGCNAFIEGRSGARHEVDVLAETTDALTTYRVAIECKAGQSPIEKDVVAKLHYILGDLGLNKGIIVALAGCRSGAATAAGELGIELWGPDEVRRHLGDHAVGELGVAPSQVTTTTTWGYGFMATPEAARASVVREGKGWFRLRTLEKLVWFASIWLPAYAVRLSVTVPETHRLQVRLRSMTLDNLYEAVEGRFIGSVTRTWDQLDINRDAVLPPSLRETKLHSTLRGAFDAYDRVTSPTAISRHGELLEALGVPAPCSALTIDRSSLVHLPYHVGVLASGAGHRAVAVSGSTGEIETDLSHTLTENLSRLHDRMVS